MGKNWYEDALAAELRGEIYAGHRTVDKKRSRKSVAQIRKENKEAYENARTVERREVTIKRRDGLVITQVVDVGRVPVEWINPNRLYGHQLDIANQSKINVRKHAKKNRMGRG